MVTTSKPITSNRVVKKTRVRISKSGQITLPAHIRRNLGVNIGDHVDVVESLDGTIELQALEPLTMSEFAGSLGPPPDGKSLTAYLGDVDRKPMVRSIYEEDEGSYDPD